MEKFFLPGFYWNLFNRRNKNVENGDRGIDSRDGIYV